MVASTRSFAAVTFVVSAAVLGAALLSQYWGGLAPCELCLKERWPWYAALAVAAVAFALRDRVPVRPVAVIVALVFIVSGGLAFYHVGVEQHWFPGPSSCTASATANDIDALRRQILGTEPVLCDQVQWSLFGVSLAGWNLVASLAMAGISIRAVGHGMR